MCEQDTCAQKNKHMRSSRRRTVFSRRSRLPWTSALSSVYISVITHHSPTGTTFNGWHFKSCCAEFLTVTNTALFRESGVSVRQVGPLHVHCLNPHCSSSTCLCVKQYLGWVLREERAQSTFHQSGPDPVPGSACRLETPGQALEPPPCDTPAWLSLASKGGWCTFRKKQTNMEAVGVQVYRPCSYESRWVWKLGTSDTGALSILLTRVCVFSVYRVFAALSLGKRLAYFRCELKLRSCCHLKQPSVRQVCLVTD